MGKSSIKSKSSDDGRSSKYRQTYHGIQGMIKSINNPINYRDFSSTAAAPAAPPTNTFHHRTMRMYPSLTNHPYKKRHRKNHHNDDDHDDDDVDAAEHADCDISVWSAQHTKTAAATTTPSSVGLDTICLWDQLLEKENDQDIDSIVSREFGPLHRPPTLLHKPNHTRNHNNPTTTTGGFQQRRNPSTLTVVDENETLVTYYGLTDVILASDIRNKNINDPNKRLYYLTGRIVTLMFVLGALVMTSFATTTLIMDTFQLYHHHDYEHAAFAMALPQHQPLSLEEPSQRFVQLRRVLLPISGGRALNTYHSPQVRALDWLANHDAYRIASDSNHLIQRYALAVLFFSTTTTTTSTTSITMTAPDAKVKSSSWSRDVNWLSPQHECSWYVEGGVRACTNTNNNDNSNNNLLQEVTDLSLWNNLKGTIPTELFQLTKLQVLYLARNQLHGTIPTELGQLTDLQYLGLHHNQLSGTIPTAYMTSMIHLKTISLEKNDLVGSIMKPSNPLCMLRRSTQKKNALEPQQRDGEKFNKKDKTIAAVAASSSSSSGSLTHLSADCKTMVQWKPAKIHCDCCTKCYI